MMQRLSDQEIASLLAKMTPEQKLEFLEELEEQERRIKLKHAQTSMTAFASAVYPGFKEGAHHRKLAKIFADVSSGKKKRYFRRGFWGSIPIRRSLWRPTRRVCRKISVVACEI